jgi:Helix-turn-helix
MKKRRTETVALKVTGPARNRQKAIRLLADLGFENAGKPEALPWRDAFPGHDSRNEPGVFLAGARAREGLIQKQLSGMTGVAQRHISEMENSKRPIGKAMAMKLAKALHVDYRVFL